MIDDVFLFFVAATFEGYYLEFFPFLQFLQMTMADRPFLQLLLRFIKRSNQVSALGVQPMHLPHHPHCFPICLLGVADDDHCPHRLPSGLAKILHGSVYELQILVAHQAHGAGGRFE